MPSPICTYSTLAMLQPETPLNFRDAAPKLTKEQLSQSTMDLYQEHSPPDPLNLASEKNHFGAYRAVRQELDWTYHRLPTKQRQLMQDSIVHVALNVPPKVETSAKGCLDTPVVIFTAGGMGAVSLSLFISISHAENVLEGQKPCSHPVAKEASCKTTSRFRMVGSTPLSFVSVAEY